MAAPELIEFPGICDASAAVALDENRLIVGDDELPWLSVYRLDTQEQAAKIPLPLGADDDPDDPPEADIEAATVLGDHIVWMSSHEHLNSPSGVRRPISEPAADGNTMGRKTD